MESLGFIQWCLDNLNYFTITLLMAIESSFIPFPSEIVVTPAAYKAAHGELNIYWVVFFSTFGAMIGAIVNYLLAMSIGRVLVYKFANSRVGHMLLLSEEKVVKAEKYFNEHGIISTLVGRLIPGIRQLISIPAGLAKMKLSTFIVFTVLGAGIWNAVLALIGFILAKTLPMDQLLSTVEHYSHIIGYSLLGIVALVLLFLIYRGFIKKHPRN